MIKIVFDLDGVLRDVDAYLCDKLGVAYPEQWEWMPKGKGLFEHIRNDNYRALVYAPATEYFLPIKKHFEKIEIWSYQIPKWQPYTKLWLNNNLTDKYTIRYLKPHEKEKRLYASKDTYLLEDYPKFKNYDRILLVDRPYNQKVKAPHRIKTVADLKIWLEKTKE